MTARPDGTVDPLSRLSVIAARSRLCVDDLLELVRDRGPGEEPSALSVPARRAVRARS